MPYRPNAPTRVPRRSPVRHASRRARHWNQPSLILGALVVVATIVSVAPAAGRSPTNAAATFGPRLAVGGSNGQAQPSPAAIPRPDSETFVQLPPAATAVPDASIRLASYVVQSGDSIYSIAVAHHLAISTVMWANHLTGRLIHIGQVLRLPPVDGVIVTVASGDTLESIGARTGTAAADIASYNGISDATLAVGQVLIVPGGNGFAIDLSAPDQTAPARTRTVSGGTTRTSTGGCPACFLRPLRWPVPGGRLSQGFGCTGFWAEPRYGSCAHFHGGIDIQAPTGTRIVAAAGGRVTQAGWSNNGGGYSVCVDVGHGVTTCYHHMSRVATRVGARVAKGALIGYVGMTGNATGPHLHFEIWIGAIWTTGYRVNPMLYF